MNRALSSLRKNEAFRTVYQKGRVYAKDALVVYILKTQGEGIRYGIAISKKCGNAVVRHRFQRVVREALRSEKDRFACDADLVVVAGKGTRYLHAKEISGRGVRDTLCEIFRRAHLFKE